MTSASRAIGGVLHARRMHIALMLVIAACIVAAGLASAAGAHAPHDDIADVAFSPSFPENDTVFAIVRGSLMRSVDGGTTWRRVVRGLGSESAVATRLSISPSGEEVMYLATRDAGVFRSDDAGQSFRPVSGGLDSNEVADVAVSPDSEDLVLARVGVGGLYRSEDGGESWDRANVSGVSAVTFVEDSGLAIIGQGNGPVLSSNDGGESWRRVARVGDARITAIAADSSANAPATIFVGSDTGAMQRSDDGGETFEEVGDGLPEEPIQDFAFSPSFANDGVAWAATRNAGVFRSDDRGDTWSYDSNGLTTDPQADEVDVADWRSLAAAVDASGDQLVLAGGFDGLFSSPGGAGTVWTKVNTLTEYIVGLAVSPNFADDSTVAVTTYLKGAYVSDDAGTTWRFANDGLLLDALGPGNGFAPVYRLHNIAFSPDYEHDGTVFSATWTRLLKSTDRARTWTRIRVAAQPDTPTLRQFVIAVSPEFGADQTLFVGDRQGGIYRSNSGGEEGTWTHVGTLDGRIRSLVVSPDFADDGTVYAGTITGVYRSDDGGLTWKASGPSIQNEPTGRENDPGALVAISPAYGTDGTVFAGTDHGLFVTRDRGESWMELTSGPLSGSDRIEAVAVSPDYQRDGTVLVSGGDSGLARSTDGGVTFEAVGSEIYEQNLLVADFSNPTSMPIEFSPTYAIDDTIFAYAQSQVLRSTDGGDTWAVVELPPGAELVRDLNATAVVPSRSKQEVIETPFGNLSWKRIAVAVLGGVVVFAAFLWLFPGPVGRRKLLLGAAFGLVAGAVGLVVLAA